MWGSISGIEADLYHCTCQFHSEHTESIGRVQKQLMLFNSLEWSQFQSVPKGGENEDSWDKDSWSWDNEVEINSKSQIPPTTNLGDRKQWRLDEIIDCIVSALSRMHSWSVRTDIGVNHMLEDKATVTGDKKKKGCTCWKMCEGDASNWWKSRLEVNQG